MNEIKNDGKDVAPRRKLGLALSGGGFRASLFHLGVLRRMAELDLLRYVEVLSTVSGGSIIGALYMLLLKKRLDDSKTLDRDHYIEIIEELEDSLIRGIQKNLRCRLFMNPFGILWVLISGDSLGKRMARIYERYLYRKVVQEILPKASRRGSLRPGFIRLKDLMVSPGGEKVKGGLESYNREAVENAGSAITKLVLNATSLNSGKPFYFTAVEIGDPRLGFFRHSEFGDLSERKKLLHELHSIGYQVHFDGSKTESVEIRGKQYDRKIVSLAVWLNDAKKNSKGFDQPVGWLTGFETLGLPGRLRGAELGRLREMKLAAWYIRKGSCFEPQVRGGFDDDEHMSLFWKAFWKANDQTDEYHRGALQDQVKTNEELKNELLDFVLELYYLRSAEVMSSKIDKCWNNLTLGEAVGASACFPPVFPPFIETGIYDDSYVTRLGLTDGGVYDNVGLTALRDELCTDIIASDTSGLFDVKQRASAGRLGMMGRIAGILMDDVAGLQRDGIRTLRRVTRKAEAVEKEMGPHRNLRELQELQGLAFFHINSPPIEVEGPGIEPELDRNLLASIRTDLDGFGDVEIAALVNHGYDTADRYIRKYFGNSPYANEKYCEPPQTVPMPLSRPVNDVEEILRAGQSRFFRALKLRAPLSVIITCAMLVIIIACTWNLRLSVSGIIAELSNLAVDWVDASVPFVGAGWTRYRISIGGALLLVTVLVLFTKLLPHKTVECFKDRYLPLYRRLMTIAKWTRKLSRNVLWIFGALPVVIAGLCFIYSIISYVFFYTPFYWKTRDTKAVSRE
jgi:predicted acylesterase/phospholipase RssA